jgi:hypothetical protein
MRAAAAARPNPRVRVTPGESDPIKKSAEEDPWCRSGTQVSEGSGRLLVVAVGEQSQWGKTMALVSGAGGEDTPLQEKLADMASAIGKVGLGVAVACFIALLIKWCVENKGFPLNKINDHGPVQFFLYAVTIVVVAVPEGLPLAVTISLAYSMKKMMKVGGRLMGRRSDVADAPETLVGCRCMQFTRVALDHALRHACCDRLQTLLCSACCTSRRCACHPCCTGILIHHPQYVAPALCRSPLLWFCEPACMRRLALSPPFDCLAIALLLPPPPFSLRRTTTLCVCWLLARPWAAPQPSAPTRLAP